MKLSELDASDVTAIPEKLTRNTQREVPPDDVGPNDLAPGQKISRLNRFAMDDGKTYGPENDPDAPKDKRSLPAKVKDAVVGSVESVGRGVKTIATAAMNPKNVDSSNDSSRRREVERGLSDVMLGYPERIANSAFPELAETRKGDAEKAPGYRDAGGVVGGFLPNPVGVALGGVANVAKEAAPGAANRIAGRQINELSKGAHPSVRGELGQVKPELRKLIQSDPEIVSAPKDTSASLKAVDDALAKRTTELDRRYQSATDKYVSDGVPEMVSEPNTTPVANSKIVPESKRLGPNQGDNPILEPNKSSMIDTKSIDTEEPTARIEADNLRARQPEESSHQVIDMKPNGTLEPSTVKASIVSKANELERSSAPQSDHVHGVMKDLEREITAETKATHADPSLRWWRQKATDYQHVANKHAVGKAESDLQAAHTEIANVIRDSLEKHMQDPEVNRLNGEVSALMKLKKVLTNKEISEEAPGNSPGKKGSRLASMFKGTADAIAVTTALATGNPAPLAVPLVLHGGPIGASIGDRLIAKIAAASASGKPTDALVAQALKSGISQEKVDSAIRDVSRIKR
jgi:hypothetical protein